MHEATVQESFLMLLATMALAGIVIVLLWMAAEGLKRWIDRRWRQ